MKRINLMSNEEYMEKESSKFLNKYLLRTDSHGMRIDIYRKEKIFNKRSL